MRDLLEARVWLRGDVTSAQGPRLSFVLHLLYHPPAAAEHSSHVFRVYVYSGGSKRNAFRARHIHVQPKLCSKCSATQHSDCYNAAETEAAMDIASMD